MKISLKEKLLQMFILGFNGTELSSQNKNIQKLIKNGLGGVIYFTENIKNREQFSELNKNLQILSKTSLFTSIDQEGGRVERTKELPDAINYINQKELANYKSTEIVTKHTQILAEELLSFGINMNFAPVLDVNTNPKNPIIAERSFSQNTKDVIKYSKSVYKTLQNNKIIPVGKHFPGHGDTGVDSHLDMPEITLNFKELEEIHVKPFKEAIKNNIDALMIAHVYYHCLTEEKIPASLSCKVVTEYLKENLNFKGLIISDDMVMGGITKHYSTLEACKMAINAGVDILIFRNSDDKIMNLIENLENAITQGEIPIQRINESYEKIIALKQKYNILNKNINYPNFNVEAKKAIIEDLKTNSTEE